MSQSMANQVMMNTSSSSNENLNGLSMSGVVDGQPPSSDNGNGSAGVKNPIPQPNGSDNEVENGTPPKKLKADPGYTASGMKQKQ